MRSNRISFLCTRMSCLGVLSVNSTSSSLSLFYPCNPGLQEPHGTSQHRVDCTSLCYITHRRAPPSCFPIYIIFLPLQRLAQRITLTNPFLSLVPSLSEQGLPGRQFSFYYIYCCIEQSTATHTIVFLRSHHIQSALRDCRMCCCPLSISEASPCSHGRAHSSVRYTILNHIEEDRHLISSMGPTSDSSLDLFLFLIPVIPESSPADLVSSVCHFFFEDI